MRTFLIIMFLLAAPCLAAAGNMANSETDRELLCEIMSKQVRMGIIINGIAANWNLWGEEFMELGEFGPSLAEAVEAISGRLPEPVAIEAPDFTEKRGELLRKAAKILGGADSLALKIYGRKDGRESDLSKLGDMEGKVKELLLEIAK